MYHLLDDYALTNNLRGANARLKVLFSLLTLCICVISPSFIVPVVIFAVMSSLILFAAKIPFKAYAGLIIAPAIMGLISLVIMAKVYPDGLNSGLLIMGRVPVSYTHLTLPTKRIV